MADPNELVGTSKGRVRDTIDKILGTGGWAVKPKVPRMARGLAPRKPVDRQEAEIMWHRFSPEYRQKKYGNSFERFLKTGGMS